MDKLPPNVQDGTVIADGQMEGAPAADQPVVPDEDAIAARPLLDERHEQEAERRSTPPAFVVYEAIRIEGEDELRRPSSALAWSGLAAGLSMGFSLVAEGLLRAYLPDAPWVPLVAKLGYSVGFLMVIMGRQQLFTENTLTVIIPLLKRKSTRTFLHVMRLWAVVLLTNVIGTLLFASAAANTNIFSAHVRDTFALIGSEALQASFATTLMKAVFAGWLIALMVWLLPVAEAGRLFVIIIITYIVGLADLAHVVAGSAETLYAVAAGVADWSSYLSWFVATLIGNIIGGVALVAALNHAQVVAGGQTA